MASSRYLVYNLLGYKVGCDPTCLGRGHKKFSGIVESVTRDIFDDRVLITVSGRRYAFDEPTRIVKLDDNIIFVYGVAGDFDDSDDSLFEEIRCSAYGETINEILNRPTGEIVRRVTFTIGKKTKSKKRGRR